jgi:SSS family solute:Na+ symporter
VIFAALLAAAMSSLDSALNSLSAATVRDFIGRKVKDPARLLLVSKLTTVAWGVVITGFAFLVGQISETVVEAINKIGSAFYGPILAAFIIGVSSKKASARGVLLGIPAGVAANFFLWLAAPGIHWMWWNMIGFVVTVIITLPLSRILSPEGAGDIAEYVLDGKTMRAEERSWLPVYGILVLYFLLMLLVLILL